MSTVIKSTDRDSGIRRVAFNFEDIAAKANQYLDGIRAEAVKILAEARQKSQGEALAIKARAEQEGRQAGLAAVEQTIAKQLGEQLATLAPSLQKVVADIRHAKQAWLTQWEKSGVRVATAIARRVVRRELSRDPSIAATWLREALELAAGNSLLRVHMHPDDLAALAPQRDTFAREIGSLTPIEWIGDPEITAGGCRVETQFGCVDQQLESQLARIEEELT
jgi:flagellar assembly protein FliH